MTKTVRIENADTSDFKVVVEVWEKGFTADGVFSDNVPDMLVKEIELNYPTAMTGPDLYITHTRYLVVKEKAPE